MALGSWLSKLAPVVAAILVVMTVGSTTPGDAAARSTLAPAPRAVWVWTQPEPASLVRWAADEGVGTIFLQVPASLSRSPYYAWARAVVTLAHKRNIRVQALNGDPGWLDRPAKAVEWLRSAEQTKLFDGIHVDVEPWALPGWQQGDQPRLVAAYLSLLRELQRAGSLPLEADISFSLDRVRTAAGQPADQAVMRIVDAVTIMTYRNAATGPDGMLGVGTEAVATARRLGRPYRLAAETLYYGDDAVSRKQTFHGLGGQHMRQVFAEVDGGNLAAGRLYRGIAVHHYDSWRALDSSPAR